MRSTVSRTVNPVGFESFFIMIFDKKLPIRVRNPNRKERTLEDMMAPRVSATYFILNDLMLLSMLFVFV